MRLMRVMRLLREMLVFFVQKECELTVTRLLAIMDSCRSIFLPFNLSVGRDRFPEIPLGLGLLRSG
jgi:hypothetical protein